MFDGLRTQLAANRAEFYWTFPIPFYSYNREGATLSEAVRQNWVRQAMMGAANAQYECIKAFSETDFTGDLRSIDIPVLILHGEDDQIVPVANGRATAELLKRPTLKIYPEAAARHGDDLRRSDQRRPARLHQVVARMGVSAVDDDLSALTIPMMSLKEPGRVP